MNVYGLRDAKWYPLLNAGDLCEGGVVPPTFGPGVDIGCVKTLQWEPDVEEAEDNGDDGVCCEVARTKKFDLTITHGGINGDLVAALRGASQTPFTVGPISGEVTRVSCTDSLQYGAIIGQSVNCDETGDMHVVFPYVKIKTGPGGSFANGAFFESTFTGTADKSLYDCCEFYHLLEHPDDVVDIPTVFPGLNPY